MKWKKFSKNQRSSFSYWFWHWLAFNYTAIKLKAWKPKYLLHDMEKPFLKLIWDYKKVQKYHRYNNNHHLEYKYPEKIDWEALIIDWESSRLTKLDAYYTAYETFMYIEDIYPEEIYKSVYDKILSIVPKFLSLNLIQLHSIEYYNLINLKPTYDSYKIFIAGKMEGLDFKTCNYNFLTAKDYIKNQIFPRTLKCDIYTPVELTLTQYDSVKCLDICLNKLKQCDHLYLLPNYNESLFAVAAKHVAEALNLNITELSKFDVQCYN